MRKKDETWIKRFSEKTIWQIWSKGIVAGGNDPVMWRKDEFGAWMLRGDYGKRNSEYGWVIDHIEPLDDNTTNVSNLRPMHWKNTIRGKDGIPECHMTSAGVHNDKPIENKIEVVTIPYYFII